MFCTSQLPQHFEIVPLPIKIVSWLTSSLQRLPVKEQLQEAHTKAKLDHGDNSKNTSSQLDLDTTSSFSHSASHNGTKSYALLPWLCGKRGFHDHLMTNWLKEKSKIPSRMYVRPSGRMAGQIQPGTTTTRLASFYQDYTELSGTRTQTKCNRKLSHLVLSSQ